MECDKEQLKAVLQRMIRQKHAKLRQLLPLEPEPEPEAVEKHGHLWSRL